ncbi:polyketide synthase [Aspergillus neoniger CBS 115656]|uniref:Polyketide synthase n=1 Tax=Aspergillus neoniger (strain CBS 115656) TaxID=1448310 RepID=A0A318YP80_ASPNB|nr:polyketide synthase [Aspergillus neoniger CBS 115656]PYH35667.1 polyketide synthase [Aspergillus neoniger CBS 115656]
MPLMLSEDSYCPSDSRSVPLAIVGFAFEFPQEATSSERFWEMIRHGRSASTDFPTDRMNIEAFYHPSKDRPSNLSVRGGNFIREDLGAFDAPFFSITPGEAACMDPQHRRMLEATYHALEDAGIPIEKCSGTNTAVYTGCFTNDYQSVLQEDFELEATHAAMGIAPSMLAHRVSWFFNFKGVSMNLDSACSSSLVALHLAAQGLAAGNSSMALVGGANIVFHPNFMKMMSSFNFLSPDSRSWSFDKQANGYARGEGIGMLVVKRLSDALRDGDCIRAVIRNTGANQDGRTPGITQPNGSSQLDLIKRTYDQVGLDMGPTRFFEAHGTGTPVGDPIEANAIGQAFSHCRSVEDPLYIGAVKANIGHLEGASGLAGLIKTILVLEHGIIPPIAGFRTLNPRIDANQLRLKFPKVAIPWPSTGLRRACVNSFGFGGTNSTVILDDAYHYLDQHGLKGYHQTQPCYIAPSPTLQVLAAPSASETTVKVLVWSAADQTAAEKLSAAYHDTIRQCPPEELSDLAYTLTSRRSRFPWRGFTVTGGGQQLEAVKPVRARDGVQLAFVFTGQGAQYLGMGKGLISVHPVFKQTVDLLDADLHALGCSWSLRGLFEGDSHLPINQPEYSQPATTCLQIALVDLLQSWGVQPAIVVGHSSGEIAAGYAAGALSRATAVKIAYHRGRLSSQLASQRTDLSMMAVGASVSDIQPYLARLDQPTAVIVGCVNSPTSITLTGSIAQLHTLQQWLEHDSIFARMLRVPMAYHSPAMNAIAAEYRDAMGDLLLPNLKANPRYTTTTTPMISSVTQALVTPKVLASADYWVRNLTSPVEFCGALSRLLFAESSSTSFPITHLLEIGPHRALQGPITDTIRASAASKTATKATPPRYLSLLDRKVPASTTLLQATGHLFCAGFTPNLLLANNIPQSKPRPIPSHRLPSYPFNHSQTYWKESRLGKNFRFRTHRRHDLLGTRSLDWNPQIAQWRNIIRLREVPWLRDHTLDGQILCPGTGMLLMAVEAFRQLGLMTTPGIEIRDARFIHALRVPAEAGEVETQLTLISEGSEWTRFRLFAMEGGSYVECCEGRIRGAAADHEDELETLVLPSAVTNGQLVQEWVQQVRDGCSQPSPQDIYDGSTGSSLHYGPAFQNVKQLRLGPGATAVAAIDLESWKRVMSEEDAPPYAVHPCTMDGLAQLVVPALNHEQRDTLPTMVPARASRIWMDLRKPALLHQGEILAVAQCRLRGHRGARADVVGMSVDGDRPLLCIEGLETSFIEAAKPTAVIGDSSRQRQLCTSLVWRPDVDMLDREQLREEVCRDRPSEAPNALGRFRSLQVATLGYVIKAMEYLAQHPEVPVPNYLQRYVAWMHYQRQRLRGSPEWTAAQKLAQDPDAQARLVQEVEEGCGTEGQFFMTVGRHLIAVLSGTEDPLELLFRDGMLHRYYEQMLADAYHAHPASRYLELLGFKNPELRVLEVGAGTGGQTLRSLQTLCPPDAPAQCSLYDYTDISPGFFPAAQQKFADYSPVVRFRTCDISVDPVTQGFEDGSYDLVLASHVLHATDRLDESLQHVRRLLKPGGKLLLFEITEPNSVHIGFAFGLLKGWWSPLDHEERSAHSPCLSPTQWDERLRQNGFSGVEIEVPGQSIPECQYLSIIVSSADVPDNEQPQPQQQQQIVIRDPSIVSQCAMAHELGGQICSLAEASELDIPTEAMVVVLLEMEKTLLADVSSHDWTHLHAVLLQAKNVLWITQPPAESPDQIPQHGLVEGFGRALASEDATRKFVTLALDGQVSSVRATETVHHLVTEIMRNPVDAVETTYSTLHGVIHIPRVMSNDPMNEIVSQATMPRRTEQWTLEDGSKPAAAATLCIGPPGRLQELEYHEVAEHKGDLVAEDEVIFDVQAFGLSPRDVLVAAGQLDAVALGSACSGIVRAAGSCTGFLPGDRVCAVGNAMAASLVRTSARAVVPIPANWSFAQAAAVPIPAWLAFYALDCVARLATDETVLVHHSVGNSVQRMAIQLAMRRSARVLATVPSESQKTNLCTALELAETEVLVVTEDAELAPALMKLAIRGIDVIVCSATDERMSQHLTSGGRLVDISWGKQQQQQKSPLQPFAQRANTSYTRINMAELLQQRPQRAYNIFQEAMTEYLGDQPPQPHVYTAGSETEALQQVDLMGGTVVTLDAGRSIPVSSITRPRSQFSADVSYVIAGGLGGLGRSLARWMASRGARHLVLLSRSGARTAAAQALVKELERQGVHVATPAVDISQRESLEQALLELKRTMPPIRGCIQATVALRDNMWENMTHEDWSLSIGSKVTGSWNLHWCLPRELDFFVLLSSLNGLFGAPGQSNYAAGNAFKDSLAHFRIAQGLKAVSIDLGLMLSEGMVAESDFLRLMLQRNAMLMDIAIEEMVALFDYYCDPTLPRLTHSTAQVVVGIEMPSVALAKCLDLHHSVHRPLFRHLFQMDAQRHRRHGEAEKEMAPIAMTTALDRPALLKQSASIVEATELVLEWLSGKLSQVLGIAAADVEPSKPIHMYGLDSMVSVDLRNWFNREIGATFTVFDLMSNTPLRELSRMAAERSRYRLKSSKTTTTTSSSPAVTRSDEIAELVRNYTADLPVRSSRVSMGDATVSDRSTILLTGSTGSLGNYLLYGLLRNPQVSKIYCLNRSDDAAARQRRGFLERGLDTSLLEDSSRVQFLKASFGERQLGLAESEYNHLLESVDTIIHNAWKVNWNHHVSSFEDPHIKGVRELINFSMASRYNAHVAFISSVNTITAWKPSGVSEEWDTIPEEPMESADVVMPQGYAEAKHVGERICIEASRKCGVPTSILRVGQIAGPNSRLGMWNPHEWIPTLIKTSKSMGQIPSDLGHFLVDWVAVDILATIVLEILQSRRATTAAAMATTPTTSSVFHLTSPTGVSWKSLIPAIQERYPVKLVSLSEWVDELGRLQELSPEEVTEKPAIKLLDFYRLLAGAMEASPRMSLERARAASRTMASLGPVSLAQMSNWLDQWNF